MRQRKDFNLGIISQKAIMFIYLEAVAKSILRLIIPFIIWFGYCDNLIKLEALYLLCNLINVIFIFCLIKILPILLIDV